ncbi:thiopeptide-type bacteriocin biosynthesis protein [Sphingobacterium sp.]|uniref:lantibiotic dehydratase n=1 Tax=Sphingobacterium sp. TaxID=341027 RepID=UPI0031D3182D
MKIGVFDQVIFRIPQFPVDATFEDSWDELKLSIKESSPNFYELVGKLTASEIALQPEPVQFTIAKYFNRARFRPTPYGTFASVGTCPIRREKVSSIIIDDKRQKTVFTDWSQTEKYLDTWRSVPKSQLRLQSNTTWYVRGDVIRYVYRNGDRFELSEIAYYPEIEQILKQCDDTINYDQLLLEILGAELEREVVEELIEELISSQLILTSNHPNILGKDYFARIGKKDDHNNQKYTLCTAPLHSGSIHSGITKNIQELITFLEGKIGIPARTETLATFISAFRKKYDQQAIPIMEALDPVTGIGYGDMEQQLQESPIVQQILQHKKESGRKAEESEFGNELLKYLAKTNSFDQIDLAEIDMPARTTERLPLPNTLSALFKIIDGNIILDHLGGATAASLCGRFNLADDQIQELGKLIANTEQNANPDVLFFDIGYMGEPSVDNINRRRTTYDFEVGILSFGDRSTRLKLSDIYLKVEGQELFLFSASLKKRLVPRLSTAYNYTRSDLSLFRLFCDLQSQGLRHSIMPDWKRIFSGLDKTPRISFKNMVLQPKGAEVTYKPHFDQDSEFERYLADLKLGRYIKAGYADQTLQIDSLSIEDRSLLRSILKVKQRLWLQEAIVEQMPVIKDLNGRGFKSEFLLSFYHKQQIYAPIKSLQSQYSAIRSFIPGGEWLYYEIYCHPAVSNDLLGHISSLILSLNNHIDCWFFIRYDEGGNHIRLRIKGKSLQDNFKIFTDFGRFSQPLFSSGLIGDIKICTYQRELERYGTADIENVEKLFCIDSNAVIEILSTGLEDILIYDSVIEKMKRVGTSIFGYTGLASLLKVNLSWMAAEHKISTVIYKQINKEYLKKARNADFASNEKTWTQNSALFVDCMTKLLKTVEARNQMRLFTDLFHMHINRCFADNQRVHEFLIYENLSKELKLQRFRPVSLNHSDNSSLGF